MQEKYYIGIDAGSVAISLVKLNSHKQILNHQYVFHEGNIIEKLGVLLQSVDLASLAGIAVTSSTPHVIESTSSCNSRIAYITAAQHMHRKVGCLLIVGGEQFGLVIFDENGDYLNYKSNTSCAAGTGSFLDQQSSRLNLDSINRFSEIAFSNQGEFPKIASRCAVFAKTDLIHAQQEGYSLEEICDGLSYGLAKNIVDTLFTNTNCREPLVFAGGVSLNKAVAKHIKNLLGLKVSIDEYSHIYGAIGAAINLIDERSESNYSSFTKITELLISHSEDKKYFSEPLEIKLSDYPDFSSEKQYLFTSEFYPEATPVETDIYSKISSTGPMNVYMGIDIGSTSTKAIIISDNKEVIAGLYTRTIGRPVTVVQIIFEAIYHMQQELGIIFNFSGVGTTGSGRKFIGKIIGADTVVDEITAHARAAYELDNEVDTIIEIGGQDSKFTTLQNGSVTFSIMNHVCAAGTGSFIEEQAKKLDCSLTDYSSRAENIKAPMSSDRCTVFMERDLNHYLNEGYTVNELLASVLHSVRENYLTKVAVQKSIGNKIFFQGATAKNKALVAAFEQKLNKPLMVSKYCHLTGALGIALDLHDNKPEKSGFRGLNLYKEKIPVRSEVCDLCTNHCKLKIAEIGEETEAFGFLCGRDYNDDKFIANPSTEFNVIKERQKNFTYKAENKAKGNITIGIPAALHMFEELPVWQRFFDLLSINTVTSLNYQYGIKEGKMMSGAEFCAPMSAIHGHVHYLLDKVDYIFLPVFLELPSNDGKRRQYCYYTQFVSSIIAAVPEIAKSNKLLTPLTRALQSEKSLKDELFEMLKSIPGLSINKHRVAVAYDEAMQYNQHLRDNWQMIFNDKLKQIMDIHVVLLGRPYSVLNPSMNCKIPDIISKQGVGTFFQDMIEGESYELEFSSELLESFNWKYAADILMAAEFVAKTKLLYPVFISSFKCSPDSFVIEYFKLLMDAYNKPYLILQLDEHDSSVGYETRIEAGLRSFRNHSKNQDNTVTVKPDTIGKKIISSPELLTDKVLLMPNWDDPAVTLLEATIKSMGIDARKLMNSEDSIRRCLTHNTGQCLPLNIIVQDVIDYVEEHQLDPKKTAVWMAGTDLACNFAMYPGYMKKLFTDFGNGLEDITVYLGNIALYDFSFNAAINAYLAFMFSGYLRKIVCRIRPYELIKGETDIAFNNAMNILYDTFLNKKPKEEALKKIIQNFKSIEVSVESRPKVAIFGDLYVRDNDVMNQNLVRSIEENGGEALVTPYSEYIKIVVEPVIARLKKAKQYKKAITLKLMKQLIPILDRKYYKYFNRILKEPVTVKYKGFEKKLEQFNVSIAHSGESMDNVLKILSLAEKHRDIALFVQTNPPYCCPALITKAMSARVEEITGSPVVTIEYDGTGAPKNEDIIPYLKYLRNKN